MRILLFVMILFISFSAQAGDDDFITYAPSAHLGLGVEMPTGMNKATYGMMLVKGYLWRLGPEEIGIRVLGLGASLNADGGMGVVLSPVSYYIMRISVGPEFIFPSTNQTNFGISISYKF